MALIIGTNQRDTLDGTPEGQLSPVILSAVKDLFSRRIARDHPMKPHANRWVRVDHRSKKILHFTQDDSEQ